MEKFNVINPSLLLAPLCEVLLGAGNGRRFGGDGAYYLYRVHESCVSPGSRLFSSFENDMQPQSFISGQTKFYTDVTSTGKINMIVVVFQPYALKAFFPMSMYEFHEKNIALDDIGDPALNDLKKRVLDTVDDNQCISMIENYLLNRLHSFDEYNMKRIDAVVKGINEQPMINVTDLSQIACLSDKQLNRIFTEYVGSMPKEFIRIVRLQRALYLLQNSATENFTQLAYECGFYDQAHLIKEFKAFSGYTPKEYLLVCDPYSDYFSDPL